MVKVGIFGGSFDPVHKGHVKLVRTLAQREGLDRVLVVPNWQSPWKPDTQPASCEDRLNMLKLAFARPLMDRETAIRHLKGYRLTL